MTALDHGTLIARGLSKPGATLRYPFDPAIPVLFVGSKMFALFSHTGGCPSVNLKTDPEEALLLRAQYPNAVLPGYHMNKRHWNTVVLSGAVPEQDVLRMLDESYMRVWKGLPRREKDSIAAQPSDKE